MAFRSRAGGVWATLHAERRTLEQGLVALVLSTLAGFVSGLTPARPVGSAAVAAILPSTSDGGALHG